MVKILIDTCVWLDLVKDPQQQSLISVLEGLVAESEISIIVPKLVLEEFHRNKQRVISDSNRSYSALLKRVKELVDKYGEDEKKTITIEQLQELNHRMPLLAGSASGSAERIEKLIGLGEIIEISIDAKLRAVQRGIDKKAPFHRQKNSLADALIIETYADCIQNIDTADHKFVFLTHNINDFSLVDGNNKLPHQDIAHLFFRRKSLFSIDLAEVVSMVHPEFVSEIFFQNNLNEEPRKVNEIYNTLNELEEKIWYNRHQNWLFKIESGEHRIVDRSEYDGFKRYVPDVTPINIYEGARASAKKLEKKYGLENLGPWDDFEWGMLNGKQAALRWVMGEDWDSLNT
jgi:hypothetical protein